MADPMRIRAVAKDGEVIVKVLMSHEMETGQRKDSAGKPIPAHFIQHVTATWQGKVVLSANWGTAIAKNPFLRVQLQGRQERRQDPDHLDRQQGRQAHRRGHDQLEEQNYPPSRAEAGGARGDRSARQVKSEGGIHVKHQAESGCCAVRARVGLRRAAAQSERRARESGRARQQGRARRTRRGRGRVREVPRHHGGRPARPSCSKPRARSCGRPSAGRRTPRWRNATSASDRAWSRAPTSSCRATSPTPAR